MNPKDVHCENLIFSDHAINQMFKGNISVENIRMLINLGEVINDYPNDKPFPSCLILGYISKRPIHLVVGVNKNNCVIITAYEPDPNLWDKNFKLKSK